MIHFVHFASVIVEISIFSGVKRRILCIMIYVVTSTILPVAFIDNPDRSCLSPVFHVALSLYIDTLSTYTSDILSYARFYA